MMGGWAGVRVGSCCGGVGGLVAGGLAVDGQGRSLEVGGLVSSGWRAVGGGAGGWRVDG